MTSSLATRRATSRGLISAGRASGNLGLALRVGGDSVAREVAIRRELIDALSYPAFVFAALAFATGIILLVVAPALAPLLEDLPPGKAIILRGLVAVSVFVKANVLGLASIAMALALVGAFAARTDSGRFRLARLLAFGVPGGVVRDIEFGAWAMGAGYLLEAGVSAPMAAEQAVVFVRNAAVKRRVQNVSERIRDGQSFARAAQSIAGLPVTVASLAMIGEQAGSLPAMLRRSGEQCQAPRLGTPQSDDRYCITHRLARARRSRWSHGQRASDGCLRDRRGCSSMRPPITDGGGVRLHLA